MYNKNINMIAGNMTEYRSCHSIEGELFFNHLNKVGYCCMLTPSGGQPVLFENYHGELIDWERFFKLRKEHIELMKNGSSLDACKDCLWIKNADWGEGEKKYFKYILINIWVKCNLFCSYCSNHKDLNVLNNTDEYNIIPVLTDMFEKGVVNENTRFDIAGGESTLDPNFDELINLLIDKGIKSININTNATIFSESIRRGIEKGVVSVITSIDCADSKKYELIKKKNLYNTVWKNLKKYSCRSKNSVRTKYIILPGVNDTKTEILKFIIKSKITKADGVILNIDLNWLRENSENALGMYKVIELTKYFIKAAKFLRIDYFVWAHIEDLIKRYNMINPNRQTDISFIYKK